MKRWHWVVVSVAILVIAALLLMAMGSRILFGPRQMEASPAAAPSSAGQ